MKHLIIAPHADDEVLGVGGTTDKFLNHGDEVYLVICGLRDYDSTDHIKAATSKYTTLYQLPFEDELYYSSFDKILKSIESVYCSIEPDSIFIPNRDDFNRDHRCVYEICEIVCRRYQQHSTDRVLMYEIPSSTTQSFNNNFKCNYYESLDEQNVKRKIETFLRYENEIREYPHPRSSLGIETYARFRGMESGEQYAEGFCLLYSKS
jgi:N-acetylglucosamine malate deacetylase 1